MFTLNSGLSTMLWANKILINQSTFSSRTISNVDTIDLDEIDLGTSTTCYSGSTASPSSSPSVTCSRKSSTDRKSGASDKRVQVLSGAFISILLILCLNYPSMVGALHVLCLSFWPVTLFFTISGNHHMLQGSMLIWRQQVARIKVKLHSWITSPTFKWSHRTHLFRLCVPFPQRRALLLQLDFIRWHSNHWIELWSVEANYYKTKALPLS